MKMILAFVALFSIQQAFSQETELRAGDFSLSAAQGEIVSVSPICPQVPGRLACMAYGSHVTVKVSLNGCLDRLGGYSSRFEYVDGKAVLYFSAINIMNEASLRARCITQASKLVTLTVPHQGEFELVNLDFQGVK